MFRSGSGTATELVRSWPLQCALVLAAIIFVGFKALIAVSWRILVCLAATFLFCIFFFAALCVRAGLALSLPRTRRALACLALRPARAFSQVVPARDPELPRTRTAL